MRCPKCRYISFERVERCRNCGYDFSFAPEASEAELPLRDAVYEAAGPLADFSLKESSPAAISRAVPVNPPPATRADLPLFDPSAERWRGASPASTPRAPLGVRRSASAAVAQAPAHSPPKAARLALEPATARAEADAARRPEAGPAPAGTLRRLTAAVIDVVILAGVDLAVLYFTLRLCGLGFDDLLIIPLVPFVGFLLLLNGGYLAGFTAACGQTIGKMALGIRVVAAPVEDGSDAGDAGAGGRVSFGFAALRTVAYLASALPVGLGFLPAFVGRDRRALHDRLAETRVVKVSSIV